MNGILAGLLCGSASGAITWWLTGDQETAVVAGLAAAVLAWFLRAFYLVLFDD